MAQAPATIAFFDSGQGGLTIWSAVVKTFPQLNTIYLGDNARYPFGTKSAATVKRYTLEAILALVEQGADAIVVACGTASSVAVPQLTSLFAKPIFGIVDPMCDLTHQAFLALKDAGNNCDEPMSIALMATPYTVKSGRFSERLQQLLNIDLAAVACPLLVPLVEEGFHDHAISRAAVSHYLQALPRDTRIILLGCTHFPRLTQAIAEVASAMFGRTALLYRPGSPVPKDAILLIDPALAIPNMLCSQLGLTLEASSNPVNQQLQAKARKNAPSHRVFCTDGPEGFERTARFFCDGTLPAVQKLVISL
jgi:glutamate racemase